MIPEKVLMEKVGGDRFSPALLCLLINTSPASDQWEVHSSWVIINFWTVALFTGDHGVVAGGSVLHKVSS